MATHSSQNIAPTLITEEKAARLLSLSKRTLRNWRVRGGGPPFIRISKRCIRYRVSDLESWAERNVRKSTSDLGLMRSIAS